MIGLLVWSWQRVIWRSYYDTYVYVCNLVEERYYSPSEKLQEWADKCRESAKYVSGFGNKDLLLEQIRSSLGLMGVSHLDVYGPVEDKLLWQGEAENTGLKVRIVENHFIVYEVIPGSPAEIGGILPGDEIISVGESIPDDPYQLEVWEGDYQIKRGRKEIWVYLNPVTLKVDKAPYVTNLSTPGTGLLRISSFRGEYFEKQPWTQTVESLKPFKHLVLDLRKNAGGNFGAMLRALSSFTCEEKIVGQLLRASHKEGEIKNFTDELSQEYQLKLIEGSKKLRLQTFTDYSCYSGRLTVLIDISTSSVAEILALALKEEKQALILGEASAGNVVMAIWYQLSALGPGYSLSIPEAEYISSIGTTLEGEGLWPDKFLDYRLSDARSGIDTWVVEASKSVINK